MVTKNLYVGITITNPKNGLGRREKEGRGAVSRKKSNILSPFSKNLIIFTISQYYS